MSKTMNYTVEEINLMCIYHTSDRYILIKEMETALLLWSSVFVTLVAKKYRFMQFELDMVFDTH